ncbi:MAG: hypothetical protein IT276_04205 [Ignavibacteriaceae bacterium]|nr:hypothetical protein [Ignavibacteriaceae bacterium]HMN24205.1 hypothetical protein [Ignavibacteriaceae bacterium]HRN26254.1 hypothetical protein [Ignavibacteriaceae bacterium]HRP91909.1 hypothetical protein [Ignavibacteriaceae bacterium]HRQ53838.1 hypothetical protein [Ignavibacteriaceae bacterium]
MSEFKISLIDVCIKDLSFPIKIGLKNSSEGINTLADMTVRSTIDRKMENDFKIQVPKIINDIQSYVGPRQLSSKLINFIDTLNAKSINIIFKFPFFYGKKLNELNERFLVKYPCEYSFSKTSLINYKQTYKVEVPIIAEQYQLIGIPSESIDMPLKIIVEIESFEAIFIEDIIRTVEHNFYRTENHNLKDVIKGLLNLKNQSNVELDLIESIKKDLFNNNEIKNCSVEFNNQRIPYNYSIKVSAEDSLVEKEVKNIEVPLFI